MKILLLEDDVRRTRAMVECLSDRFPHYEVVCASTVVGFLAHLERHFHETILIALDHDLELIPAPDGQWEDPGTGRDVAEKLARCAPVCPVVIHSTNLPAALGMQRVLEQAGWKTYRVSPFADLEWVRAVWFRTVRDAVVAFVAEPLPSASN